MLIAKDKPLSICAFDMVRGINADNSRSIQCRLCISSLNLGMNVAGPHHSHKEVGALRDQVATELRLSGHFRIGIDAWDGETHGTLHRFLKR